MKQLELKYGCNPNQKPASISVNDGRDLPIEVLNGKPGYINFMDALNSWQLVKELKEATGLPAAASFKHVSPAGAAVGLPLSDTDKAIYFVAPDAELTPHCLCLHPGPGRRPPVLLWRLGRSQRHLRRRHRRLPQARGLRRHHRPRLYPRGPGNSQGQEEGGYNIVKIDPNYVPAVQEHKDVFGITFEQGRNNYKIDESLLTNLVTENKTLPDQAKIDMIVALITLKYTQSNSVCYVKDGQAIGVGAGQQSRIHCTRLAGNKADNWYLRQHPKTLALQFLDNIRRPDRDNAIDVYLSDEYEDVLREGEWQTKFKVKPEPLTAEEEKAWIATQTGVTVGSDAFFPFGDNVERAKNPALPTSWSPAAPSGMTTSSTLPTAIIWSWPSPACACSITKEVTP